MFNRAMLKNNKVIVIVHDLNEIRTGVKDKYYHVLENADVIILHTSNMKKWAMEHYNIKGIIIILNIFDYILPMEKSKINKNLDFKEKIKIAFCGNLQKANFLEKIELPDNVELILYGANCSPTMKNKKGIIYKGAVLPEELPNLIGDCNFGLVWDGNEVNECSGMMGRYLQYNAPYKLSLYLSSGLPLIIWSKMGIANYLNKRGVAISLDSLNDLGNRLNNISDSEYKSLSNSAIKIGHELRKGKMGLDALNAAFSYFKTNKVD